MPRKNLIIILSVFIALVLGAAGFLILKPGAAPATPKSGDNAGVSLKNEEKTAEEARQEEKPAARAAADPLLPGALLKTYNSPAGGFSFSYPESMNARVITTDEFDVIVVEGKNSLEGFQIVISSFPDDAFQPSNLEERLNGAEAKNVRNLTVGYSGKGLIFFSNNPSFEGGSIEAWFAKGGRLYQATAYARNEVLLLKSLASWKFDKDVD